MDAVLVRPARPANVAAAARALKNMGLERLVLVEPPPGLAESEARSLAYGAWDVLDSAVVADSLGDAVAGASFVVGASSHGGAAAWTPRELGERAAARAGSGRLAVVFGPEASGLKNAELRLCHETVTIPTGPRHSSLNLAQAVLIVAYELFLQRAVPDVEPSHVAALATSGSLEEALLALREGLVSIGYLNKDNPDALLAELRRMIGRSRPSEREVNLLRGMARQLAWAGGELARLRPHAP